jgi:hypothetical protein
MARELIASPSTAETRHVDAKSKAPSGRSGWPGRRMKGDRRVSVSGRQFGRTLGE